MFCKQMFCSHEWTTENYPEKEDDTLSLAIADSPLLELFLAVSTIKRTCNKCSKTQIYEDPKVCGGSTHRWVDFSR